MTTIGPGHKDALQAILLAVHKRSAVTIEAEAGEQTVHFLKTEQLPADSDTGIRIEGGFAPQGVRDSPFFSKIISASYTTHQSAHHAHERQRVWLGQPATRPRLAVI
jgi:hypothetical protein